MQAIKPNWNAPKNVQAFTTLRHGGVSLAPYDSFNLGDHVGDDKNAVKINRTLLVERFHLQKMPLFLNQSTFEIGKSYALRRGKDVALFGTGVMTYQLLLAAEKLANEYDIQAEVIHFPTIKPLDEDAVLDAAQKCQAVITAEEGQIAGGFGSSVAEVLSDNLPVKMKRIGVNDAFGESGKMSELWQKHGLDVDSIVRSVVNFLQ